MCYLPTSKPELVKMYNSGNSAIDIILYILGKVGVALKMKVENNWGTNHPYICRDLLQDLYQYLQKFG